MVAIGIALFSLALVGLAIVLAQFIVLRRHLRKEDATPHSCPPISVLKPLCGIDDDLASNIAAFAEQLDYPEYEVLLGVKDRSDPAHRLAESAAARWPGRIRVVLQEGSPGLNPKVNQLVTLARHARHDILVISDSNVLVERDYLDGIAAHLEDPGVGLVTHPVAGVGERSLGALLDNLHLSAGIGAGTVAAKCATGKDLVVGKSMAMRRRDVEALGGFEVFKDVLAEDWLAGKLVPATLGKRVVVARRPVRNVTRDRSVSDFVARYVRWSTMQRFAVGPAVYAMQALLNPLPFAAAGAGFLRSEGGYLAAIAVCLAKCAVDVSARAALGGGRASFASAAGVPLKDALVGFAWLSGLVRDHVEWRGNRLRVLPGTRLAPAEEAHREAPRASSSHRPSRLAAGDLVVAALSGPGADEQ